MSFLSSINHLIFSSLVNVGTISNFSRGTLSNVLFSFDKKDKRIDNNHPASLANHSSSQVHNNNNNNNETRYK